MAAERANFKIVYRLLQAGANPQCGLEPSGRQRATALSAAARGGSLDIVALLLKNSANQAELMLDCARSAAMARYYRHSYVAWYLEQHLTSLVEHLGRDMINTRSYELMMTDSKLPQRIVLQIRSKAGIAQS